MFEIIQHQQQRFFAEIGEKLLLRLTAWIEPELDGFGNSRNDEIRGTEGLQGDKVYAAGKAILLFSRRFYRQPRLTNAAGADEREQAAGRVGQQLHDRSKFIPSTNERRRLQW